MKKILTLQILTTTGQDEDRIVLCPVIVTHFHCVSDGYENSWRFLL